MSTTTTTSTTTTGAGDELLVESIGGEWRGGGCWIRIRAVWGEGKGEGGSMNDDYDVSEQ